eukprot:TRINITY_DN16942_c0_g3_i1.p1 TRINITY_DN16942_c0_g3~~TRINITY_DN16942_c0_g3_i1.p1  ORF type:complete len:1746 (-),score=312.16 TRINITY_DN16942_c0_g3_i1:714-5951(-)
MALQLTPSLTTTSVSTSSTLCTHGTLLYGTCVEPSCPSWRKWPLTGPQRSELNAHDLFSAPLQRGSRILKSNVHAFNRSLGRTLGAASQYGVVCSGKLSPSLSSTSAIPFSRINNASLAVWENDTRQCRGSVPRTSSTPVSRIRTRVLVDMDIQSSPSVDDATDNEADAAKGREQEAVEEQLMIDRSEKESRSEAFVKAIEEEGAEEGWEAYLEGKREIVASRKARIEALQAEIDALYDETFSGLTVPMSTDNADVAGATQRRESSASGAAVEKRFEESDAKRLQDVLDALPQTVDENAWAELGRSKAQDLKLLINAVTPAKWQDFQSKVHGLTLTRNRLRQALEQSEEELTAIEERLQDRSTGAEPVSFEVEDAEEGEGPGVYVAGPRESAGLIRAVLISGFESFNVGLYRQAADKIKEKFPGFQLKVYSDRDLQSKRREVEEELSKADVFFGSLIFDYDQCEWLKSRVANIPIRLVFESSLELMSTTSLGSFVMAGGKSKGMPAPVKAVLSKFGGGREEDKMVGYLSFLKIGPKLLRFVPGKKVRDLRNWLTIYGYWNQGGIDNVVSMFLYLAEEYLAKTGVAQGKLQETPALGLVHPDYEGYFTSPKDYLRWYRSRSFSALPTSSSASSPPLSSRPVVAVLLYRKHVITGQRYIPQMLRIFEAEGLIPVPVFINGVEAHTVVRDLLTTRFEQEQRRKGIISISSLSRDAIEVDAVVSTIGFPLVGGPAGTMEGGRQAEVAKSILQAKNIPYLVASPLLIQDIASWQRQGVQGLQSVVLYSLPELDGAIDAVPLGGLVGDGIHLVPERVRRLTARIKSWVNLRRVPPAERKVAIVLYGFPPGVGATGTAALLNVPKSLENILLRLKAEGYNLGDLGDSFSGEDLVTLLAALDEEQVLSKGKEGPAQAWAKVEEQLKEDGRAMPPVEAMAETVDWRTLKTWLGDTLTGRMEKAWGELPKYRNGIHCDAEGQSVVNGVWLGNIWIGVQPLLGLEGDPMRLLFERDLTPHPQYAAFYKWLQNEMKADAVVHFGMHGTVEWLPGSPLGNTGLSWSDVLLGNMPNLYIYAANNPSESIVAKRRGYGTIISHNVPPYGRAGLYKELAALRELMSEYREDPVKNEGLRGAIVGALVRSGLQSDCPFQQTSSAQATPLSPITSRPSSAPSLSTSESTLESGSSYSSSNGTVAQFVNDNPAEDVYLTEESLDSIDPAAFDEYMVRLYDYLALLENRLFSEGLHTLGAAPNSDQMGQYLSAYFGEVFPERAVEAVCATPGGLDQVKRRLEELLRLDGDSSMVGGAVEQQLAEAVTIRELLLKNTDEVDSLIHALQGDYVLPAVGGDLLRDGPGVLPTGRNIHALDPYRMPSAAAWERGSRLAANIIDKHRKENEGNFPETVAVMLWGLDAIKTRGESVAIALALVGAFPLKEGTGRIARFELRPLEELGRPRIDVLANMSGIFRDSFANVVELLDDLFKRAAEADEPSDMNFIRKHSEELKAGGVDASTARIFSNPAGDYGSMVNERIGAADWENGAELGTTWQSRNSFSYGRGEQGVARPEVLQKLLQTTERIVQEIDSVEYGLTDIQEYYANTGAMKNAAQAAQGGKKVACTMVEAYGKDLTPRDLEATLKLEYRSKLLNPKWAEKMAAQGSGGAYEISQRMTALIGWGGTTDFKEDWVYNQAAETYALDEEMAAKLRKNNPQAFRNIVKRMLEASGRGLWQADEETIMRLRSIYDEIDSELEGVKVAVVA